MTIVLTLLLSSFWVASAQSLSPAPVTGATATYTVCSAARLTWELSVHDNPDSAGVTGYTINLGTSAGAEDFELLATVPAGTTTYLVEFSQLPNAPSFVFRIDTFRDEEVSLGSVTGVTLLLVRLSHTDADGNPVYILVPDGATPFTEDFEDFLALAFAFGSTPSDENWNPLADTNDSCAIDFTDFLVFANSFGRVALDFGG